MVESAELAEERRGAMIAVAPEHPFDRDAQEARNGEVIAALHRTFDSATQLQCAVTKLAGICRRMVRGRFDQATSSSGDEEPATHTLGEFNRLRLRNRCSS